MSKTTRNSNKIKTIAAVGLFSALAYVACVLFHFKAGFLTFDLKDAFMTVGAMMFGPLYGFAMVLIVSLIEAVTIGSTGIYGFIMNVLSSTAFVCVGSLIYYKRRKVSTAIIAMAASVVSMTAVMMAANFLITPYYMNVSVEAVGKMIPTLFLPFNLTKAVFNAALTFVLYAPITVALTKAGFIHAEIGKSRKTPKRTVIIIVCAVLVAVAALVYFFTGLDGSFNFA